MHKYRMEKLFFSDEDLVDLVLDLKILENVNLHLVMTIMGVKDVNGCLQLHIARLIVKGRLMRTNLV